MQNIIPNKHFFDFPRYVIPEGTMDNSEYNFKMLIFLSNDENNDKFLGFLSKILQAIGYKLQECEFHHESDSLFSVLENSPNNHMVLCFDSSSLSLKDLVVKDHYTFFEYNNHKILKADTLSSIMTNVDLKRKLWNQIQLLKK